MDNLFAKFREKVPRYDQQFRYTLFDRLTKTGGGSELTREQSGKSFSNHYELFIYAFFLGLYNKEYRPIPRGVKLDSFNHAIQFWGSKGNRLNRKDFTILQEYIFVAVVAKSDLDFVALDKGEISVEEAVKELIFILESYTNGGLSLISEKIEENPDYYLHNMAFFDAIVNARVS